MMLHTITGMQVTSDIVLETAPDTQDAISLLLSAFAHTEHYLDSFEKLFNLLEGVRKKEGMQYESYSEQELCLNSVIIEFRCEDLLLIQVKSYSIPI